MPDVDDINDAIAENATGPKSVTVDGNNVNQHSIAEQIAARNDVASQSSASKGHRGLRFTKLVPPGCG
jgi:hypothetical protein